MKNYFIIALLLLVTFQPLLAQDTTALDDMYDMDIEDLMNLVVETATKTEQTVEEAPAIVTVITSNDIKNMGARELVDVLQFVPGFEVSKSVTGEILVGVRGVKDPRYSCKLLLLEDGVSVNEIFYGASVHLGYKYDLENIERIEIIRGPGSALYGRNAFSAVINMITKDGSTGKGLSAYGEAGTFNHYSGRLNYGYSKNKFNFRLASYVIKTDGSDALYPDTDNRWTVDHNNQIVSARIGYGEFSTKFSFANEKTGNWERGCELRRTTFNYQFGYKKELNEKISITIKHYGLMSHHIEDLMATPPDISNDDPGMYITPEFKDFLYGGEVETNIRLFDGNDLFVGIQADYRGVKDAYIASNLNFEENTYFSNEGHDDQRRFEGGWVEDDGHDYTNFAIYFQDIYYPTKKIGITLGARYDIESQIGGVFSPRLGVVWNMIPNVYFKLLYGSAYRSPSPSQQYQTMGFANGNSDLNPERIQTFEASLNYKTKNMMTQINLFRNYLTDMIYAETYITPDVTDTPSNRNIGENVATGIEVENKFYITKGLNTFINYSYTVSENTDDFFYGKMQTYTNADVAPHKLNAGINFRFRKYYNLSANVKYRSEMGKFFIYDADTEQTTEISKDQLGDYATVNCTFRIAPGLLKGLEFSVSAINIFDAKYYSQEAFTSKMPEQGNRQFVFKLGYIIK